MTEQQKDFVHMYLKHRDKIIAHNLAYGNNSNIASVESSANRLLRIPEIAETIRSIQDNIRHEVEEEFKAQYREELMSIYEKRLLLKKIATGELYVEQKYKGKNCTQCSQYISPTINQMLAAIKEDNKLAGHHPHKQNGKWVIPALQTETEQEEIISTLEKDNNRQQIDFAQDQEVSLPPSERFIRAGFRGIGGELPQDEITPQKNLQQFTTTENQETSPLPGDLPCPIQRLGGVDSRNPNTPEKDPSDRVIPARTTVQSGRRAGNKIQHPDTIPDTTSELSPAGGGVSLSADGGGPLAQDTSENPQQITTESENKIDSQPLVENNAHSISLPFRGIGGTTISKTP